MKEEPTPTKEYELWKNNTKQDQENDEVKDLLDSMKLVECDDCGSCCCRGDKCS